MGTRVPPLTPPPHARPHLQRVVHAPHVLLPAFVQALQVLHHQFQPILLHQGVQQGPGLLLRLQDHVRVCHLGQAAQHADTVRQPTASTRAGGGDDVISAQKWCRTNSYIVEEMSACVCLTGKSCLDEEPSPPHPQTASTSIRLKTGHSDAGIEKRGF